MRAVRFDEYGGPEVLQVVEVDQPCPGPGQVRIAVHAAGVNGLDWKIRSGMMARVAAVDLPAGSGVDASGVVDELGDGVCDVQIGNRVFGNGRNTYAEYAVLSTWATMPDGMGFVEAAGYPTPVETAVRVLDQVGIQPGRTLLVSGASGGVGSAVLQIARERRITVIATASAANQEYLRSLGATPTTYGDGLVTRVRQLAPGGVDAALDLAGSGVIPDLVELAGDPARVLSIADFTAPRHAAQVSTDPQDPPAAYALARAMFGRGRFTLPVQQTFPLEQAGAAQALSQQGHVRGRIVLTVT